MLIGERIRLRAAERSDLQTFLRWVNDPEVTRGVALYRPFSFSEEESWYDGMLSRPPDQRSLVIEIRPDGVSWLAIGTMAFHEIDWRNRSAEFGILIGEKTYWDHGYGSEAVGMLLKHGFATLNLHRIFLRVFADNPRAIRAYEKAGFVQEGRLRQAEYHEGQYVDVYVMSVLKDEWMKRED